MQIIRKGVCHLRGHKLFLEWRGNRVFTFCLRGCGYEHPGFNWPQDEGQWVKYGEVTE